MIKCLPLHGSLLLGCSSPPSNLRCPRYAYRRRVQRRSCTTHYWRFRYPAPYLRFHCKTDSISVLSCRDSAWCSRSSWRQSGAAKLPSALCLQPGASHGADLVTDLWGAAVCNDRKVTDTHGYVHRQLLGNALGRMHVESRVQCDWQACLVAFFFYRKPP